MMNLRNASSHKEDVLHSETTIFKMGLVVDETTSVTGIGPMTTAQDEKSVTALSLYEEATVEADRHKWIESQKQGRDLGQNAIREWYRVHWLPYCRQKRLEHIQGRQCWREFGHDQFGQIYSLLVSGDLLLDRILDRAYAGQENLDIITWAIDWGLPIKRVVNILSQLDVNRARLEPRETAIA